MVQINFARREVNCKIVFYGPGLSGKTTNLEIIHKKVPDTARGSLTSIATEQDRTLFFDFMPLDLGQVAGMKTKLFLYTVPGQVYYNSTRKLVIQGADGISFIADSDPNRMPDNLESLRNLEDNLREYGLDIKKVPLVIQFNKRDLPGALSVQELNAKLNPWGVPTFEAVAVKGEGVMQTLKGISKLVIDKLNDDYQPAKVVAGTSATPAGLQKPPSGVAAQQAVQTKPAVAAVASATPPPPRVQPPPTPRIQPPPPPPPRVQPQPPPPRVPPPPLPPPHRMTPPPPARMQPPPPTPRVPPAPPPRPEPVKKSRHWIWLLIVLLLVGGGAVWYVKFGGKDWVDKNVLKKPAPQRPQTPKKP